MSAFRHPHNVAVRPIEEELAEMGLNPDRVLHEIDRNTAMLESGPTPLNLSGLTEGSEASRSLAQYGDTLLAEKVNYGPHPEKVGAGQYRIVAMTRAPRGYYAWDGRRWFRAGGGMTGAPSAGGEAMLFGSATEAQREIDAKAGKAWAKNYSFESVLAEKCGKHGKKECKDCKDDPDEDYDGDDSDDMDESVLDEGGFDPMAALSAPDPRGPKGKVIIPANVISRAMKLDMNMLIDRFWQKVSRSKGMVTKAELKKIIKSYEKEIKSATPDDDDWTGNADDVVQILRNLVHGYQRASDDFDGEPELDEAIQYLLDEGWELDEVFGVVKKARGAAARVAKRMRHKEYLKKRGAKKLAAKIYRKKFKRKIKRMNLKKLRKFGKKGLEKLHKMGKRVVQKSWNDQIASLYEELDQAACVAEDHDLNEADDRELSPAVEALLNAAETAMYLGEIFDAMGDEAGQVLLQLSDKAVDLADAVEANEDAEPTEEQEGHIQTVLDAVIKSLAEHEERGAPSLGEAIGIGMVAEGLGTWDELVEVKRVSPGAPDSPSGRWTPPNVVRDMKMPAGGKATVDRSVAGKYLKALNIAMQKMDPQAAMKAAEVVVKKHNVIDAKGLPVKSVGSMTDVLRVVFYLSQIAGLKAPAWMYRGKKKPWFVSAGETDEPKGLAATDAKLVGALKALGAPAGLLKAMAA